MPLQATSGAASYDAFGGGVAAVPNYIEDVFSTWLYTGNGSTQTITNGIDLAGEGGMIWTKCRSNAQNNTLVDTVRGTTNFLITNNTNASSSNANLITSVSASSYQLGSYANTNSSGATYASWTFRKQPKFFDVVTGTQSVAGNVTLNHNLGSVPGCIIVKNTDNVPNSWNVYHRSLGTGQYLLLNNTDAASSAYSAWGGVAPTATQFTIGYQYPVGTNFVAYVFAHNAGGFGLTGTDNVISCGSYVGNGSTSGPIVNLGYEPQWLLIKNTTAGSGDGWHMFDNMRGLPTDSRYQALLQAHSSAAEIQDLGASVLAILPNGFQLKNTGFDNTASNTYIYIAIRRGPMKVPTDGTKVFKSTVYTGDGSTTGQFLNMPDMSYADASLVETRSSPFAGNHLFYDRLRGETKYLQTRATAAEATSDRLEFSVMKGLNAVYVNSVAPNYSGQPYVAHSFRRAPGFFDEVCWTATSDYAAQIPHNLGVAPELLICKSRVSATPNWEVALYNGTQYVKRLALNLTNSSATGFVTQANPHTSTYFVPADVSGPGNISPPDYPGNYVAYLFATCPGVSKVFSFTGNGSTQTINCGFTGGARFVLLKASSATDGWYVYDTARGMIVLTDPYLQLNSTAAETATLGSVTTVSTGFAVNEAITTGVNTNGVTYIGLAIA